VKSKKQWPYDLGRGVAQTSAFASLRQHGIRCRLDPARVLETTGIDCRHPVRQWQPIIGREDTIANPI